MTIIARKESPPHHVMDLPGRRLENVKEEENEDEELSSVAPPPQSRTSDDPTIKADYSAPLLEWKQAQELLRHEEEEEEEDEQSISHHSKNTNSNHNTEEVAALLSSSIPTIMDDEDSLAGGDAAQGEGDSTMIRVVNDDYDQTPLNNSLILAAPMQGHPKTTTMTKSEADIEAAIMRDIPLEAAVVEGTIYSQEIPLTTRTTAIVPSRSKDGRLRQRRCIFLLSLLAVFLTCGVVLLVSLTVHRRTATANSLSSSSSSTINVTTPPPPPPPKDPPLDVDAPPPTTVAPIVPGSPTMAPSTSTIPTMAPTTAVPTIAPVAETDQDLELLQQLRPLLWQDTAVLDDETSVYYEAYRLLGRGNVTTTTTTNLAQRFALAILNVATGGNYVYDMRHECQWWGIGCDDETKQVVTSIAWPGQSLKGSLPTMGLALLTKLTRLDLGNNRLQGRIPESLYNCTTLQNVYLHENNFTGTLSKAIGRLTDLRRIYLGGNQLTGLLPRELGSPGSGIANVRPLEFISLYDNQFVGPIPPNWNLRKLFYLDLGKNQLSGPVPKDWCEGRDTMDHLRLLYLDQNNLGGQLSSHLGEIGKGRLNLLTINDNAFTGAMPLFANYTSFLNRLEIHNNNFTSMDKFQCAQAVYNGGEMVQMKADCDICICNFFCGKDMCY